MQQVKAQAAGARLVPVAHHRQFSSLEIVGGSRLKRAHKRVYHCNSPSSSERSGPTSRHYESAQALLNGPLRVIVDINPKLLDARTVFLPPRPHQQLPHALPPADPMYTFTLSRAPQSPTSPRVRTRARSGPCGSLREAQDTYRMLMRVVYT
ncbi:hypothetical protein DFH06DRAFT_654457 [Mycena polygramma]|nr:hypothetical protein DFH06DRAFT_654457 [Mycena polygramma]